MILLQGMKLLMKICLWALAFVPLIVAESVFFPYISGKSLLIRLAIALTAVLFLTHFSFNKFFRNEIYLRIQKIKKNPLILSVLAFMVLFTLSTIFAFNKFRALYGDVERGEGFIGIFFFFGFFVFSLLLFAKKDWLWFFKLSLFSGLILFIKEIAEVSNGIIRPGSFTGNPTFLAGYLLFIVAASAIVFYNAKNESSGLKVFWRIFSGASFLMAVAGIFITQTRGTIVGLFAGVIISLIYSSIYGGATSIGKINLKKLSLYSLIFVAIFLGTFFLTKSNAVWQKIPGFDRLAKINISTDFTAQTRLISLGVSAKAINPSANGYDRFLLGWGMENFSVAYNKYYNPHYYFYEKTWFDRAHNKLMDVLVMNGVLGFVAYMAMWISFLWLIFRKKVFSYDKASMLFFGTALFVHLLFVFDQISTYIPFFAFLSFLVFSSSVEGREEASAKKFNETVQTGTVKNAISFVVLGTTTLFSLWALIYATIVPYSQMSGYLKLISSGDVKTIEDGIDSKLAPYTYAQENLRTHFLNVIYGNYSKNPGLENLLNKGLEAMEDLAQKEPYNPRNLLLIGQIYDTKAKTAGGDGGLFNKAEEFYRKAYDLAPMRQDIIYSLSANLAYQEEYDEAISLLEKSVASDERVPESHFYLGSIMISANRPGKVALDNLEFVFDNSSLASGRESSFITLYNILAKHFYDKKDKENFIITTQRLQKLEPEKFNDFQKAIDAVNKEVWPIINFN